MAKPDPRKLKDEAAELVAKGKWKKALENYLALEKLEPKDGAWPQRAGDMLRKLGETDESIGALGRAVEVYSKSGFLLKAIAVCKLVLELDPGRSEMQAKLAALHSARSLGVPGHGAPAPAPRATPAAVAPVAHELELAADTGPPLELELGSKPGRAAVAPAYQGRTLDLDLPPPPAPPIAPRAAQKVTPLWADSGVLPPPRPAAAKLPTPTPAPVEPVEIDLVIDEPEEEITAIVAPAPARAAFAARSAEPPPAPPTQRIPANIPLAEMSLGRMVPGARRSREVPTVGDATIFEIPLGDDLESSFKQLLDQAELLVTTEGDPARNEAEPAETAATVTARTLLPRTPLFSALDEPRLLLLIQRVRLRSLSAGDTLFHKGDPPDALYVIAQGEVGVYAESDIDPSVEVARLAEGTFFGEIAFLTNQPRNATIKATTDSELLAIDRQLIGELIEDSPEVLQVLLRFMRDRLLDTLVDTNPLFAPFSGDQRLELASKFKFLEVEEHAILVTQGERAAGLFIVLCGHAKVTRDGVELADLGGGDLFGEMSLLSRGPAVATIRAASKIYALVLPRAAFQEVIMTHPQVLEYLSSVAEERQRDMDQKMSGGREGRIRVM